MANQSQRNLAKKPAKAPQPVAKKETTEVKETVSTTTATTVPRKSEEPDEGLFCS